MKYSIRLLTLFLVAVAPLFQSCLKDEANTVILPEKLNSIPDEVLDKALVDSLRNYMAINEGDDAPLVAGLYVSAPTQLVFASDNYSNNNYYDLYIALGEQNCRGSLTYDEHQNMAYLSCPSAYVVGSGRLFTMSLSQRMTNDAAGWWCDVAIVLSGEMSSQGIAGFEYAIVMKEKYDPYEVLLEERSFRVYKDSDGISERTYWSPQQLVGGDGVTLMIEKGGRI